LLSRQIESGRKIRTETPGSREATGRLTKIRTLYFGGDSSFEAEPVGPVVVFGIAFGLPLAPPDVVIPEPPPELVPVVPFCIPEPLFMAPLFMPEGFSLFAELLVGPVLAPACP
jgi:hypothetical protein